MTRVEHWRVPGGDQLARTTVPTLVLSAVLSAPAEPVFLAHTAEG